MVDKYKMRLYQKKLYESSLEDNYVVVLPTGAGKTLIAVHLAKKAAELHPDKTILFIAPTVSLCNQQQNVFQEALDALNMRNISVSDYSGNKSFQFNRFNVSGTTVMVTTPQKVVNCINERKWDWDCISLVIFDECHHAKKKHPYALIMENYSLYHYGPKVVGLTASPGNKPQDIVDVVTKMRSKIVATREGTEEHKSLTQYLSIPEILIRKIELSDEDPFKIIDDMLDELIMMEINKMDDKDIHFDPDNEEVDLALLIQYCQNNGKYENFTDMVRIKELLDYGDLNGASEILKRKKAAGGKKVEQIIQLIREIPKERMAPKICELINIFKEFHGTLNRGIIFVETREGAQFLCGAIQKLAGRKIASFSASFIVGHNNVKSDVRMNLTDIRERLAMFNEGKTNIMVCTNVAEEGIDIKECNFVIRMNAKITAISMIQSRGRARYPNSKYFVICETDDDEEHLNKAINDEKTMKEAVLKLMDSTISNQKTLTSWGNDKTIEVAPTAKRLKMYSKEFDSIYELDIPRAPVLMNITKNQTSSSKTNPFDQSINYKGELQSYFQKIFRSNNLPLNYTSKKSGSDHFPVFVTKLVANAESFVSSGFNTKKESEQHAAYLACLHFNVYIV